MDFKIIILILVLGVIVINLLRAVLLKSGTRVHQADTGFFSFLRGHPRNEAWMFAAGALELEFLRPSGLYARPGLRGNYRGFFLEAHIVIRPDGNAETVCSLLFPGSLERGLLIMQDLPEVLQASFTGRSLISLPGFDSGNLRISAADPENFRHFMTAEKRVILKNCLGFFPYFEVKDLSVCARVKGENLTGSELVTMIERVAAFAEVFRRIPSELPAGKLKSAIPPAEDFIPPRPVKVRPVSIVPEYSSRKATVSAEVPRSAPVQESVRPAAMPPAADMAAQPAESSPVIRESELNHSESVPPEEIPPPENASSSENASSGAAELCSALFSTSFAGPKEKERFESVKNSMVEWEGILKSAYSFDTDFVFGRGPGVKASFEIAEISSSYMKVRVKAVVCLPPETLPVLKDGFGKPFRFRGKLSKAEFFAREIILTDGQLLS